MEYKFDAVKVKNDCVAWIRDWFDRNGKDCNAVIGISGGKDSSVVAALCVEALGKNRVFGVLMPNGIQSDIDMAYLLCNTLDIKYDVINIGNMIDDVYARCKYATNFVSKTPNSPQAEQNLPPRIRMSVLYYVAQCMNGRVANTCNLSEDWVGYATRWGDSCGDFCPLANLTTEEVCAIGRVLGLPDALVDKVPSDGLCGKTDEDNLGFTYAVLNKYLRTGEIKDENIKTLIDNKHKWNKFKMFMPEKFEVEWKVNWDE